MIRIGTRASLLARAQTDEVVRSLRAAGEDVEVITISTSGDRSQRANTPVPDVGVGVFVSELRQAVLDGRIDAAVHSYKDLPTEPVPGISLVAVPSRVDPRDVLVTGSGRRLDELPYGATVGTGAPRRATQLAALGLGLDCVPMRGNVDRRLAAVASGEVDAVVLAHAGLARLGRLNEVTEILDPLVMLPAAAQGALACECRTDDVDIARVLRSTLNDPQAEATAGAERAVLTDLGWDCSTYLASMGVVHHDDQIVLRGFAVTADGRPVRASVTGALVDGDRLGRELAQELLTRGAVPPRRQEPSASDLHPHEVPDVPI